MTLPAGADMDALWDEFSAENFGLNHISLHFISFDVSYTF
jgi:hypothetical protein